MTKISLTPGETKTTLNPWDKPASERVAEFLKKAQPSAQAKGKARICFALDATASRQPTWDSAMRVQSEMFLSTKSLGTLSIQLMFFQGFGECKASRWMDNPETLLKLMTGITCKAGSTQISKILSKTLQEHEREPVSALIFIGDAFEESEDHVISYAHELGLKKVPVFIFREGHNLAALKAFEAIAQASGGAHLELSSNSPEALKNLLAAVATFAVGGLEALKKLQTSEARELLRLTHKGA